MSPSYLIILILFLITSIPTLLYFSKQREEKKEKEEKEEKEDKEVKEEEDNEDIKPPTFSHTSGFYPDNFTLKLSSEQKTTI